MGSVQNYQDHFVCVSSRCWQYYWLMPAPIGNFHPKKITKQHLRCRRDESPGAIQEKNGISMRLVRSSNISGEKYTCMKQFCHILCILKLYCKFLSEYNFYILHQMYKYSILNQTEAVYFFNFSKILGVSWFTWEPLWQWKTVIPKWIHKIDILEGPGIIMNLCK